MNLQEVFKNRDLIENELKAIYEAEKKLTAEIVLNKAKDKNNPLHNCFTWDNENAAHEYRLWEARKLIQSVKITINTGVTDVTVRKYVNLRTDDEKANAWGKKSEYKEVHEVLTDDEKKVILFDQAMNELNAFRRKYHSLQIFERIFNEIDKLSAVA